jgi:hypothetical protein
VARRVKLAHAGQGAFTKGKLRVFILDSGGLSYLAKRNQDAAATIRVFVRDGLWPPVVPSGAGRVDHRTATG